MPVLVRRIGLNDRDDEGMFVWVSDGSEMTYSNWAPGQPDDFCHYDMAYVSDRCYPGEDCVHVHGDATEGTWNDDSCEMRFWSVCDSA